MADTSVGDLDANFVRARGADLNVFDNERLPGFPGDGGLAGDSLCELDAHEAEGSWSWCGPFRWCLTSQGGDGG